MLMAIFFSTPEKAIQMKAPGDQRRRLFEWNVLELKEESKEIRKYFAGVSC